MTPPRKKSNGTIPTDSPEQQFRLCGQLTVEPQDTRVTKEIEACFQRRVKAEVEEARPKAAEQHAKAVLASREKIINNAGSRTHCILRGEVGDDNAEKRRYIRENRSWKSSLRKCISRFNELKDKI